MSLSEIIAEPASLDGERDVDSRDEHVRWRFYSRALESMDARRVALLARAVERETDRPVALSAVLHVLERIRPGERAAWIGRLAHQEDRDYAAGRARDLALLDVLIRTDTDEHYTEADWSLWLQLRLAERARGERLLAYLAAAGGTRRIRRTAAERSRGG